jgi:hypothetical protein
MNSLKGLDSSLPRVFQRRGPKFGMSDRQISKRAETLAFVTKAAREALARNDIGYMADEVAELLEDCPQ